VERADVIVVGAGVMGSAAARALGERGLDTILLEQFDVGHARGSSHGPTRIFRLSYPFPDYVRLAQRALRSWRALEEAAGESLLVTTGGLESGAMAGTCGRALQTCGVLSEWLSTEAALERFPGMDLAGFDRVLYQADAGVCLADRTVAAQVRLARKAGVEVREGSPVTAVRPAQDRVTVETAAGVIEAGVAIIAAGPWAREILSGAGQAISLEPILQHVSYFRPAAGGDPPDLPTYIEWGSPEIVWYAVPAAGDAPGLKIGEHAGGEVVDPGQGPFDVDPARRASHAEKVRRRFPSLDPEPVRSETCLYTMTPDEDFVLDRIGPIVIGAGFSGHGFKFGPLIGEILADLAMGRDPELPPGRFAVDRPALRAPVSPA
jgi:sarcosine oxidase